jgi:type I restriction enzyme S subunit
MPLIRIRDIGSTRTQAYFDGPYRREFLVEPGDVLIAMDGDFRVAEWHGPQGLLNQRVTRLVFRDSSVDRQFVALALRDRIAELRGQKAYTTVDHLSGRQIAGCVIPLPPLDEQVQAIATARTLWTMIDEIDTARERLDRTRALGRRALLTALAQADPDVGVDEIPELVRDGPDLRDVEAWIHDLAALGRLRGGSRTQGQGSILDDVFREKVRLAGQGLIKGPARAQPTDGPYELPGSWAWARLSDICLSITDGDHQPPPTADNGIPFLVIGDVSSGSIQFRGLRHVPESYYATLDWAHRPRPGDLLYTVTGSVGITVQVHEDKPFCVQRHIAIIRPASQVLPRYLQIALTTRFVRDQLTARATGTAQKTLPLSALRSILVPLAPSNEQQEIVAAVDRLSAMTADWKTGLASQAATRERTLRAVLASVDAL